MYKRKAQVGVRVWAWSHRYRVNGADDTSSNCLTPSHRLLPQIIDYGGPTATPTQDTQGSPGNSGGSGGSQPQQRPRIASLLSSTLRDSAAGAVESTAATAKYEPS